MPGPEAAGTTPPPTHAPPPPAAAADADVIDLHRRTKRPRPGDTLTVATDRDPALERLAAHAQAVYREAGRDLLDQQTAEAYRIALRLALQFLDAAQTRDPSLEAAFAEPRGMLLAACHAPDIL